MPIVRVDKDLDGHTMTVVAEYDAPVQRVWQLHADPRQLERFWGPPQWPATVVSDGFADDSGEPNPHMPTTRMELELAERAGGGTTMTVQSTFASTEAMAQLLEMGMEEGIRQAMGQIDAILAEAG